MYNDFVVIGPKEDPAKIKSVKTAVAAVRLIKQSKSRFVSRGDNSGTHNLEKSLWKQAGIEPKEIWYIEAGQGLGATLGIANERNAYDEALASFSAENAAMVTPATIGQGGAAPAAGSNYGRICLG